MRRIRSKHTSPELQVRRFLHRKGLRYQLYRRDLPGNPDLVFPGLGVCLFVHGCFWHGCQKCIDGTRKVKSRVVYWNKKIAGNRKRDRDHIQALTALGWKVYVIWECEVRETRRLSSIAGRLLTRREAVSANKRQKGIN